MSEEKKKSTLRELLEEGPTDPLIMAKLGLLEELKEAVARKDTKAMLEIGQKLRTNAKEIKDVDAARRASIDSVVEKARAVSDPEERTKRLLEAFEFCAKMRTSAYDEAVDRESGDAATDYLSEIADALDAISPGGRSVLVPFLDSPDVSIRVAAAFYLRKTMPDRTTPILQEIKKNDPGSPGWWAMWALPPDTEMPPPRPKRDGPKS